MGNIRELQETLEQMNKRLYAEFNSKQLKHANINRLKRDGRQHKRQVTAKQEQVQAEKKRVNKVKEQIRRIELKQKKRPKAALMDDIKTAYQKFGDECPHLENLSEKE